MNNDLIEMKNRVIDMMIRVRGPIHTLGWLRGAYLAPVDELVEIRILQNVLLELAAECEKHIDGGGGL